MIDIAEFTELTEVTDKQIRDRASQSRVARSRQLLAYFDSKEAGYLSFDDRSDISIGVLYDLFVLPAFRCTGIGSTLIERGENLSRVLGHRKVRVLPRAFDSSVSQEWLESWYKKLGYIMATDGTQEYEKTLY